MGGAEGVEESMGIAPLAFKGFPVHEHEGKDVSTSDANDGRCYALCLRTGISTSDAAEADGGRLTHVHLGIHGMASEPGSATFQVSKELHSVYSNLWGGMKVVLREN